jgi:tetratricopeptide (TPR) repeat protein
MNKRVKDFYKDKKALIVTNSKEKGTWKRGLAEFGIVATEIKHVTSIIEAKEYMLEEKPHIVLCENSLADGTAYDLLLLHEELIPNRINAVFGIISNEESMYLQSLKSEYDIFYLVRPISMKLLEDELVKSIEEKIQMQGGKIRYYQLLEKFNEGTITPEEMATFKAKESPWSFLLEAKIHESLQHYDLAIKSLYRALEKDPEHHQSLIMFFDLNYKKKFYQDAFAAAESIWQKYSINPIRTPQYFQVALATKNFDSIEALSEQLADAINDPKEYKHAVAESLAMAGKYFKNLQGRKDSTRKLSQLAIELAKDHEEILNTAYENLKGIGDSIDAKKVA